VPTVKAHDAVPSRYRKLVALAVAAIVAPANVTMPPPVLVNWPAATLTESDVDGICTVVHAKSPMGLRESRRERFVSMVVPHPESPVWGIAREMLGVNVLGIFLSLYALGDASQFNVTCSVAALTVNVNLWFNALGAGGSGGALIVTVAVIPVPIFPAVS
jgi:hypothetical protein